MSKSPELEEGSVLKDFAEQENVAEVGQREKVKVGLLVVQAEKGPEIKVKEIKR